MGYADTKSFNAAIDKNPDLHPKSRQEILDLYNKYTAQMYLKLPELFGRLPKAKLLIKPVEEFSEKKLQAHRTIMVPPMVHGPVM